METPNDTNKQKGYPVDKETADMAKKAGQENNMDNPVDQQEAQNVVDGAERLSGKDAEEARNKATEGSRLGRSDS